MENIIQSGDQPVKKKTNGKRNKQAGASWEWECRDLFRALGFQFVVTSCGESKSRDNKIIDLINKDEAVNGRLPYNVQCKNSSSLINYDRIFNGYKKKVKGRKPGTTAIISIPPMERVKGIINVILHKFTSNKGEKNETGRFMPRGNYAIMPMEDFFTLVEERENTQVKITLLESELAALQAMHKIVG